MGPLESSRSLLSHRRRGRQSKAKGLEERGAVRGQDVLKESGFSPTAMAPRPSPSLCHPLPDRKSFGKAGLTQWALSKPCEGRGLWLPGAQRLSKGWRHPEATLQEGDRCGYGRTPSQAKSQETEKPG